MTDPILCFPWAKLPEEIHVKVFKKLLNEDGQLWSRQVCKDWQRMIDDIIRLKWQKLKQNPPSFPLNFNAFINSAEKAFIIEDPSKSNYLTFFRQLNVNFKENDAFIPNGEVCISRNHFSQLQEQILQKKRDQSLVLLWNRLLPELNSITNHLHDVNQIRTWMNDPQTQNIRESVLCINLSDLGIRFIPLEISQFPEITHLNLSCNHIDSLPSFIGTLDKVKHLNLCDNDLKDFPEEFSEWTHLDSVNINENPLSEQAVLQLNLLFQNKQLINKMDIDADSSF